jgi:predicted  nucleic acid-binding Zn-ribbon protein
LEQQIATVQGYAARVATLEQQKSLLEGEKNSYEEQLPALQAQLARLAESAEQISTLEALKAGLVGELDAAREQGDALAAELAAQKEACAALKREKEAAAQQTADDAQALADAEEQLAEARDEIAGLRSRVKDLESNSAEANEETLRSMVLASFNYSNLYVDNNLKTAQFISDATSRNIGRVSDSANSLLEQLEVIGRSFNDTTDHIRRNLTAFQRELGTIQSGMNRRLSQDRFKALLEENERLRNRLETELLAELNSEEDETPAPLPVPPGAIGPQIPFAEDLSGTYNEFME